MFRRKSSAQNPFRAADPKGFDRGEKVNRRAAELQHGAMMGFSEAEAITALANALGNAAGAWIAHNPQMQMEDTLGLLCRIVQEQAYLNAGPRPEAKELSQEGFDDLVSRIIDAATINIWASDAITATAKALGTMISFAARRDKRSPDELVKVSQDAIVQFTNDAMTKALPKIGHTPFSY